MKSDSKISCCKLKMMYRRPDCAFEMGYINWETDDDI